MILEGTNIIASNSDNKTRDIVLQIAQLVKFNAIKKVRESNVKNIRHSEKQETALPVYTGLLVHLQTRKKSIIDKLYSLGLSISYNRVDEIQSAMTKQACDKYRKEGLVFPPSLKRQMFTTAAIDNVDHNSTSITSKSHFHGTSISLFQHPDVYTTSKHMNFHLSRQHNDKQRQFELSLYYTDISPVDTIKSNAPILQTNTDSRDITLDPLDECKGWLSSVNSIFSGEDMLAVSNCNWAAYNEANINAETLSVRSTSTLFPLINESINSPAMVKHCVKVIRKIIQHINPNQITIIIGDQPVYALLRQIQWKYPNEFGDNFLIMMGDFISRWQC